MILKLVYNDPRRFGFFELLVVNKHFLDKKFSKFGPEPFQSEFNFKLYLFIFKRKNKKYKKLFIRSKFCIWDRKHICK